MNAQILQALDAIEREQGVKVLLAVESGSRAWGFASPDSDYDVRFIYAHPLDWYLGVLDRRDVIERMLPGDLDVSGWELRKALRLFSKCNVALNEWIGSPIVYSEVHEFRARLAALVPRYFNAIGGLHHYQRMAAAALDGYLQDGVIGIKKVFYVLRPLLACRWIERLRAQPPTGFASLLGANWVSMEERAWITSLLERKAGAIEAEPILLDADREGELRRELARFASLTTSMTPPEKPESAELDDIMRTWIRAPEAP
jgi:uncharacterized protein